MAEAQWRGLGCNDAITAEERGLLIGGRFPARVSCIAELGVPRDTRPEGGARAMPPEPQGTPAKSDMPVMAKRRPLMLIHEHSACFYLSKCFSKSGVEWRVLRC